MKFGSNESVLRYLNGSIDGLKSAVGNNIDADRKALYLSNIFEKYFNKYRAGFKNIEYWTKPFYNAYLKAKPSIHEALEKERITQDAHYSGVTVADIIGESVTYYSFDCIAIDGGYVIKNGFLAVFQKHILLALCASDDENTGNFTWLSTPMKELDFTMPELFDDIVKMELFKKYCEIETKNLPPNSKTELFHCKYINKTKVNVKVLNSTWFTNLVKSDGFNVRGHFRLQACGEGMKDRKLIWINEFQKEGYTRRAGKILEQEK